MAYDKQDFKIPVQSGDYEECSRFVTSAIEDIIKNAINLGENKIVINTNLKLGQHKLSTMFWKTKRTDTT